MANDGYTEVLNDIVESYESTVRNMWEEAQKQGGRALGGMLRQVKGKLVEDIARKMVRAAWIKLAKDAADLEFRKGKYPIPVNPEYIENLPDGEVRSHLKNHIHEINYKISQDISVYGGGKFLLSIECKAFTENAMFKRILFDAWLLKTRFPALKFALVQLESQLGGDYSGLNEVTLGSFPTHTLMSLFEDTKIEIITLLKGERKVNKEIHMREHYKPLARENLERAVRQLTEVLR